LAKVTIVGGGFSAAIAKACANENATVITPLSVDYLKDFGLHRNAQFEINKFLGKKTYSLGKLKSFLITSVLHDRLGLGGNSSIWGGFINLSSLSKELLSLLQVNNIHIKKLAFRSTGSLSNNPYIYQLQNRVGKIYDASENLIETQDAYLESFSLEKHQIKLNLIETGERRVSYTDTLVLCVGVVQLIDLLYRSHLISSLSKISMMEYEYKLVTRFRLFPGKIASKDTIIRFKFGRAINHFLGIQGNSFISKILSLVPIYLDQVFCTKERNHTFVIRDGALIDLEAIGSQIEFGKSIHYCDLKIDGDRLDDFLEKVSPNIKGGGMGFVRQKTPGPISNDIILDLHHKLVTQRAIVEK